MIWKLLRKNISVRQIAGYAAATLVGLTIIMVAIQFHRDVSAVLSPSSGGIKLLSSRNVVISKPVSLSSTLTGISPSFTDEEIDEIRRQPWASAVSPFQAADFNVRAGVDMGGRSMHTELFLESVPDDLLDIDTAEWTFNPESPTIPIVISKEYLALYNFGFAASGRMPMVNEAILSSIPLEITLTGNGRRALLPARIVGYSDWLNTVAVPQSFMDWAHGEFGTGSVEQPSRLVIEVSDPADPAVEKFLSEREYEQAGQAGDIGRAAYFLKLLTGVILSVGLIITILALGILILSLFLLVQKNRPTISGLMRLGYEPVQVSAGYIRLLAVINAGVIIVAGIVLLAVSPMWQKPLTDIDMAGCSPWPTIGVGLVIMALITFINICIIRVQVKRCFC